VLNAVWMQFDGGIGSVLLLKILPAILLLGLRGIVGYVAWICSSAGLRGAAAGRDLAAAAARLGSAGGLGYLAWLISLKSIFGLHGALPYGEPQPG
jgi:alpha-glucoside transport system permease protein